MSDLTTKFEALESQLASNHVAIGGKLDAILSALGGAPETPTVTIADLADLLTTLNASIAGMRLDASAYYEASSIYLSGINTNTDTMITNNSLNAQRLLTAIYATFCACETTVPLLPPPIDITPTDLVDEAKCRRIQFYLSVFTTWIQSIANYGSTGAAVTGDVLATLLAAAGAAGGFVLVGAEAGALGGIPGAVVGAILGLIVAAVYLLGGTQLVNWANDFASPVVQDALLAALYGATNADEGQTAFQGVVGDNFTSIPAGIINALWWSGWSNDLYSGTPEVDDSAFDGSICVPEIVPFDPGEDCITLWSTPGVTNSDGGTENGIVWPNNGTNVLPSTERPPGYPSITASAAVWYNGSNLHGYYIRSLNGGTIYLTSDGAQHFNFDGTYQQIQTDTNYVHILMPGNTSLSVELCAELPM